MNEIRTANQNDINEIAALIDRSVRKLQANDYTPKQLDGALGSVYGIDTNLINDGTYVLVLRDGKIIGCGGWSKRKALFGADALAKSQGQFLDPEIDPAKIRAFFVDPDYARQGIGAIILKECETRAAKAGFKSYELASTLTGIEFYAKYGYEGREKIFAPLPNGEVFEGLKMEKSINE